MSDEEFGGHMSDAGVEDIDQDMPDASASAAAASTLPEGVQKEVLTEAPDSEWKRPKKGDDVTVHYVGTLQSDGTELDSSRGRGQPFTFTLGKGQVIKGWDLGVATMKKGEVAKFTLAPEFAYGEAGSPPKIPANATLVFEVELLSWVSKGDLFQDGGVIKSELKAGTGWQKPKADSEVRLSLRVLSAAAAAPQGTEAAAEASPAVIEEKLGIDYTLGSGVLGLLSKAVDKALTDMKKEEQVRLVCSKDYAYGDNRPEGAVLELTLEQIYETKDVSFGKDKSLLKKSVREGDGWDKPADGNKVTLKVEAATDSSGAPIPGFTPATLDFVAGNGEVCDGLECAVVEMKKGERALLTCTKSALIAEERLGLKDAAGPLALTLELVDFEKGKDTWSMSEEEKVDFGSNRKEVGSTLFRQGRFQLAMGRYKKVMDLLRYTDNWKDESLKGKAKELRKVCELNVAACHLKLEDFFEAKTACNSVLKESPSNVKALFRRAQAEYGLRNFEDCARDLRKVIEAEPQNREARKLLQEALAGKKPISKPHLQQMAAAVPKQKVRPDVLIQKRIAQEAHYSQADQYAKKLFRIGQVSGWFEGKQKYDFNEGEKRSESFIKGEMSCCNEELKIRRRTRLRALYETEARGWEEELAQLGLAVQRQFF